MNLIRFKNEPASLVDLRNKAAEHALNEPLPDKSTHRFRFTLAKMLFPRALVDQALFEQQNSGVEVDIALPVGASGVEVHKFDDAFGLPVEAVIEKHLGTIAGYDDPILATNLALFSNGVVVVIPDNLVLDDPIHIDWKADSQQGLSAVRTLVLVGKNAKVQVLEKLEVSSGHASAVTEVVLGTGADVIHGRLERAAKGAVGFSRAAYRIEKDASLRHVHVLLPDGLIKAEAAPVIAGPGGNSKGLGMAFTDNTAVADFRVVENHAVGDTTSQVMWRSVAADNSKSIFTGLLSIAPGAARSQAFEEARSMLLSRQAVAQTIPELEILNHDVKCSHGASVAPIDPEAMFYLESRGLSKPEAKTMLVEGFVEPVLAELPIAGLADEVRTRLRAALGASPSLFDHS